MRRSRLIGGDNPALPTMPERPTLEDFYRLRFDDFSVSHMLQSARLARQKGLDEKVVLACLLRDIAVPGLLRSDHGYWGAQLGAPYVDEEVAWAIEKLEALRYVADVVGQHFRQPEEGLGFDGSPVAHMWRTMIWPNNFL